LKKLELYYCGDDEKDKIYSIFEEIYCYEILDFVTKQYCLPPRVMSTLHKELDVEYELFASPLNTYFTKYFSLF
jgi:hypothetical protein